MAKELKYAKQLPEWIQLYKAGRSTNKIAEDYKVSSGTVYNYLKKYIGVRSRVEASHKGSDHHMWGGDSVDLASLHRWVTTRKPKPKDCSMCATKPALDLANVSNSYNKSTYTRDLKNWRWICRGCHMRSDGRLNNLKQYQS